MRRPGTITLAKTFTNSAGNNCHEIVPIKLPGDLLPNLYLLF